MISKLKDYPKKFAKSAKSVGAHIPHWLIIILALVLILRIPSFFEPYSYGDETTYLTLGESIRQGNILYRDIFDHKPPFLYYVAAIAGNLFWFKTILAFWSLLTIVFFWKLVDALFPKKKRVVQVSTLIFALLTTIPLLEGNIANAENFMIGFSILAFYILLTKKLTVKNLFVGGALFSIAGLFKVPAFFDAPAIVFYWIIVDGIKNYKEIIRKIIFFGLGFIAPVLLMCVWYALRGAFSDFFTWGFLINFTYINAYKPAAESLPFLQKNLPLIIRGLLVLFGALILFVGKRRVSKRFILISLWLFFTLFAITLPERPYPHYLLQAVPPLSLLLGMLLTLGNIEQVLVILPLTVFFFVPIYYKFWYYSSTAYYKRFLDFATNKVTKEEYLINFGSHIPRSYDLASIIMGITQRTDKILVWGPESQTVYALARRLPPIRYVANFHIFDYSSTEQVAKTINTTPPKVIVILPGAEDFPELPPILNAKYLFIEEVDNAKIYLLSPSTKTPNF